MDTSSSQICSILTTTDQEQQRQYRQWTLEEKERLLLCVARCFTLNLPIYTTAHRNPTLANISIIVLSFKFIIDKHEQ